MKRCVMCGDPLPDDVVVYVCDGNGRAHTFKLRESEVMRERRDSALQIVCGALILAMLVLAVWLIFPW